jgi:uncharacterized coiled-coil protein SlyX
MALNTALIKADNLLATGPTPANTAVPSKVTQLADQNVWEYEFTNTWPQTGIWTITLNADGFSIAKGTVLGSFTVTQGTVYKLAINWETTDSVATLSSKVAALETGRATNAALATLQSTVNALQMSVNTQNNQITALTQRVETLEVDLITHAH